ncbi:MAG: carbohydrate kinase family protein [Gammaproteobacteria bacterium]
MSALIFGALAFDTLMQFEGRFAEQILPEEVDRLSVSFPVPTMRREFGGCAGNIAYNMALLGEAGWPACVVGSDFAPYALWLDENNVDRRYVRELADEFTAQAFITSDIEGNQITAFHPGAMAHDVMAHMPRDAGVRIGVIAPDGAQPMQRAARYFEAAKVPFLWDPGQFMTSLNAQQMTEFVQRARWVSVNRYEAELLAKGTGQSLATLSRQVRALVVTQGAEGSQIWSDGEMLEVPAAKVASAVDPTGCGDAYRAGLVYGLLRDATWTYCARVASVMGALAVESHGTQNHRASFAQIAERYEHSYNESINE